LDEGFPPRSRALLSRDLRVEAALIQIEAVIEGHDAFLKREDMLFQRSNPVAITHVVMTEQAHPRWSLHMASIRVSPLSFKSITFVNSSSPISSTVNDPAGRARKATSNSPHRCRRIYSA